MRYPLGMRAEDWLHLRSFRRLRSASISPGMLWIDACERSSLRYPACPKRILLDLLDELRAEVGNRGWTSTLAGVDHLLTQEIERRTERRYRKRFKRSQISLFD